MRGIFYIIIIMTSSCFLSSCEADLDLVSTVPVIDGWIDTDGFPVVVFTESIIPNQEGGSIADKIIRWGKVSIYDGEQEIILTGGPDNDIIPPYRYITYKMKGEIGKTYKITADYKTLHSEAEGTMLPPPAIKNIEISPIESNDSLRSASLIFISPDDCPAYYYITMTDLKEEGRPLPAMMSTFEASEPSKEYSIPLLHPKNNLSSAPFIPQLIKGEKWEVRLCRISKEVYEFWKAYDNAVMFGGSQFVNASQSLKGNIIGGYGVWSVQGVSSQIIEIP